MPVLQARYLNNRLLDLLLACLGFLVLFIHMGPDTAKSFASSVSSFGGILVGVASITFTIYHAGSGPKLRFLKRVNGDEVRKNWLSILVGLIVAAFLALAAIALVETSVRWSVAVAGYAAGVLATKSLRQVLLLSSFMVLNDSDAIKAQTQPLHLAPEAAQVESGSRRD